VDARRSAELARIERDASARAAAAAAAGREAVAAADARHRAEMDGLAARKARLSAAGSAPQRGGGGEAQPRTPATPAADLLSL
jgi:hypothetical protein